RALAPSAPVRRSTPARRGLVALPAAAGRLNGGNMQHASQAALFSLIGDTPLVEVTRIDTGPCQLFLKLESQNPGGSIKDRIGKTMIEQAEHDGLLQPGGTVIEATAGNT